MYYRSMEYCNNGILLKICLDARIYQSIKQQSPNLQRVNVTESETNKQLKDTMV